MKTKTLLIYILLFGASIPAFFGQRWMPVSEEVNMESYQPEDASPLPYDLSRVVVRIEEEPHSTDPEAGFEHAVEQGWIKSHTSFDDYGVRLIEMNQPAGNWAELQIQLTAVIEKISALDEADYSLKSMTPGFSGPEGEFAALWDRMIVKVEPGQSAEALSFIKESNQAFPLEEAIPSRWSPDTWYVPMTGDLPGFVWELADQLSDHPSIKYAYPDFMFSPLVTSNDTFFSYQWALKNTGSAIQHNGTAGADMEVEQAWTITHGDSSLIIAVLDSGIDTLHPEFNGKLLPGYDATPADQRGYPNTDFPQNAHGTACAGICAGWSENGIGIAGVAPGCRIMPVRVFYYVVIPNQGVQPFATSSVFAEGIDYAWQNGADVLSNSWGVPDWLLAILPNQNLTVDAMQNAHDQGRNGLGAPMLFSSGNEGDPPIWPSRLATGISVNATSMCDEWKNAQSCDNENWWSGNWGGNLDFSAPGVKIYTCDMLDTLGYGPADYTPDFNGTSAACPNAAGVAALVLSVRPDLSTEEVRYVISKSCERVGGYDYSTVKIAGYWSARLGHGRVNAYQAVTEAQGFDSIPAVGIAEFPTESQFAVYPNPTTGLLTLEWNETGSGQRRWEVREPTGKLVLELPLVRSQGGWNKIQIELPDLPAGVYILRGTGEGVPLTRKVLLQN